MHRYVPKSHVQLIKQVYMAIHYVGFKIYVIGPTIDRRSENVVAPRLVASTRLRDFLRLVPFQNLAVSFALR